MKTYMNFPIMTSPCSETLMEKHGSETAAIIMTPFGHHLHQRMEEPKPGFLESVKEIAHKYSAVLVFDEVRTGFRLAMGGAQELYGVAPDLVVLGKGMANGYAISVVTGKTDVMMAAAKKLFISSTLLSQQRRVHCRPQDHRDTGAGQYSRVDPGRRAGVS